MRIFNCRLGMVAAAALSLFSNFLHAQVNVTTYHNDVARTGQNTLEVILTPANVNATTFGKLFSVTVDGWVYAQPLYLSNVTISGGTHNVVYVATEHDSLYAIDADNGTIYWQLSLIPAGGSTVPGVANLDCGDLVPEVGITGTPVIDPSSGTIYLVAKSKVGGNVVQYLHAIDVVTATEKFGAPIAIQASVTGSATDAVGGLVSFSAKLENQRAALLLDTDSQGTSHVIIGWAAHCDISPWHGWLMSYNAATLAQEAVFNGSPNGYANGIWMSGAGPAADSSGNVYFATGNGSWNGTTDFGDSIVKLGPPNGGTFPVLDYFTPYDQANLSSKDLDVSSGGLILLPAATNGKRQIVLQAKVGTIFNLDSSNLGKYCINQTPACTNSDPQISQEILNASVGIWGAPAYWNGSVYWAGGNDNTRAKDSIKAFAVNPANGLLSTTPSSQTAQTFGFSAPIPVVSSNGTSNGILWGLDDSQFGTCSVKTYCQVLYAYDATNLANLLYSSQQAPGFRDVPAGGVKFATPTVANGKVYVGSQYLLAVYGLLTATPAATPVLSPAGGSFTSAQSVTITDATAGSTIYYTTNGTTPTTASTVYTGPIAVGATTTINAIAVATGYTTSAVATATYTIATATTPVDIGLPSPTVYAIGNRGTAVPGGGFDGRGDAFDSTLLGSTFTWSGVTFALGGPDVADAITSSTIPIAANGYSRLYMLGTAVNGSQLAQTFVVTYTDGTTTTFTQSMSDWFSPRSYAGESIALAMADRLLPNGTLDARTFNLYGYSFALNPAKTVQSFTLPANSNVRVLAIALRPIAPAIATATPVFSPAAGSFTGAQSVTITDATAGAAIYYTTNGSTPTTASTLYSGPIAVGATMTINALAVATGYTSSAVTTAAYTIVGAATTPVDITLPSPTVYAIDNPGTAVLDGGIDSEGHAYDATRLGSALTWSGVNFALGAPGVADAITSSTIPIAANTYSTLYMLGTAVDGSQAAQNFVVTYTDGTTTTFIQSMSDWFSRQSYAGESVALAMADRVEPDGTLDTRTFNLYGYSFALNPAKTVQSFTLPANNHIRVLAIALKPASPATATATATPVFSPMAGSFSGAQSVTIRDATAGSTIYYTTNGTTPTTASTVYTGPIAVGATTTINALAVAAGYTNSAVATATFTITIPPPLAATPMFSPAAGSFTSAQSVTITDATAGSTIYYTTNGTTPTTASTVYTGPIAVGATTTINALAVAAGYTTSAVATATFTITIPPPLAATPMFSPAAGSFTSAQSVTITDATAGSTIYYTTNGTTPTTASTVYTGPIAVGATTTINALAVAAGYSNSAVATVTYTISTTVTTPVDIALPSPSVDAIANRGTAVPGGGIDGSGYAYDSTLLGSTLTWSGVTFALGAPDVADAITSSTIPIAANSYSTLYMLGTAVYGNQAAQSFVVTYTDGTTTTFTQSMSDWGTPQSYPGESIALAMADRVQPNGTLQAVTYNLYGYSFALNPAKTVQSFTLPANSHVRVLAIALKPAAPAVDITLPSPTVYGIANRGTAVPGGGIDGSSYAYDSTLLGSTLTWSGVNFTLGAPEVADAVTSSTIPITANSYSTLYMLATAVYGNQAAQSFVVTYTDGTTTTFTQSVSDWGTPQSYPGESVALAMADRVQPSGTLDTRTFNLYGYSFALNPAKTVLSFRLPANNDITVLAIALK